MGAFVFGSRKTNRRRLGPQVISPALLMRYGSTPGGVAGCPQPCGVPASGAVGQEPDAAVVLGDGDAVPPIAQPATRASAHATVTRGESRIPESERGAALSRPMLNSRGMGMGQRVVTGRHRIVTRVWTRGPVHRIKDRRIPARRESDPASLTCSRPTGI